ncbi:hypothetical protein ACTU6U_15120 [Microbacterium sp. A196]|uniref:hypothetical protein n=1 Tax=Microbacterium sp. A196 TaxID=3457320 RepID=UPI003FD5C044
MLRPAPLTDPIDRHELRDFIDRTRERWPTWLRATLLTILGLSYCGILLFILLGIVLDPVPIGFFILGAWVVTGCIIGLGLHRWWTQDHRRFRLTGFAKANGLRYTPRTSRALPGVIFEVGRDRKTTDLLEGHERWGRRERGRRSVEFGNHSYAIDYRKFHITHRWGYVAIRLANPLPHIVLDAVGNNSLLRSNLPVRFDTDQRLSLEGDFDDYFTLYCPSDYEVDALYLFTPDVMVHFIDSAAHFDVEIVDDWLLLYSKKPVVTTDPLTWERLANMVEAVTRRLDQWERWRDDRLRTSARSLAGDDSMRPASVVTEFANRPLGVSARGRRLRRPVPWVLFIVTGVFLVFGLYACVQDFAG